MSEQEFMSEQELIDHGVLDKCPNENCLVCQITAMTVEQLMKGEHCAF